MLPDKAYKEYKEIYLKEYGKELSDEDAMKSANAFFDFFCYVVERKDLVDKK